MNTYTISLSSNSSNYYEVLPEISLNDHTHVSLNLGNVSEQVLPAFLKIDWGDTPPITFDNNIPLGDRANVNIFVFSKLLNDVYHHEYFPSPTSLYKTLSAQVLVHYSNGDESWFVIPIKIRTYDFFESIYDLQLLHTNILPGSSNQKEHYFMTSGDRYLIELRND